MLAFDRLACIHAEMSITADEIASQPDASGGAPRRWRGRVGRRAPARPARGSARSAAAPRCSSRRPTPRCARRPASARPTRSPASELPARPPLRRRSSRSRAPGTTTEVAHALRSHALADRSVALVAVDDTPVAEAADAVDHPRLRRRALGRADPLRDHRAHAAARVRRARRRAGAPPTRAARSTRRCPSTRRASSSGRSSAAAGPSAWPARPRSSCARPRRPGPRPTRSSSTATARSASPRPAASSGRSSPLDAATCEELGATGATVVVRRPRPAGRARARPARRGRARRGPRAGPRPPAQPDPLGRPRARPRAPQLSPQDPCPPAANHPEGEQMAMQVQGADHRGHRGGRPRDRPRRVRRGRRRRRQRRQRRQGASTITVWHGQNQSAAEGLQPARRPSSTRSHPKIKVDAAGRRARRLAAVRRSPRRWPAASTPTWPTCSGPTSPTSRAARRRSTSPRR